MPKRRTFIAGQTENLLMAAMVHREIAGLIIMYRSGTE
jgi:hypothetical protein